MLQIKQEVKQEIKQEDELEEEMGEQQGFGLAEPQCEAQIEHPLCASSPTTSEVPKNDEDLGLGPEGEADGAGNPVSGHDGGEAAPAEASTLGGLGPSSTIPETGGETSLHRNPGPRFCAAPEVDGSANLWAARAAAAFPYPSLLAQHRAHRSAAAEELGVSRREYERMLGLTRNRSRAVQDRRY